MYTRAYATKFLNQDGEVFRIDFNIVFEDEIGEKTDVGNFSVGDDNSVIGEIDDYIIETHPDFCEQAKKIMLRHGLEEIVGQELSPANYFYKKQITNIKNVSGVFERATQYVQEHNITCTTQNGYLDFEEEIRRKR